MGKNVVFIGNNSSGMYVFRGDLISEVINRGNDVTVLVPHNIKFDELNDLGAAVIETPLDRRGINPLRDFKLFKNYIKTLKDIAPKLVVTYTIKPNIYGGFACRLLKIPYAVNITGLGTAFQNDGLLKKIVTVMYKISLKKAKVVFFENCENREIFVDLKIVNEKKTCLLNGAGVNLDYFTAADYPDGDVTNFLFVGRVMKEKGIEELFEAMKMLLADGLPVHLDVLGPYEENYKPLIEKYEGEGWLTYHGVQNDVRPYIAKSHCFVLPSWHEGMANTNLECAASARPVITSNIHGCMEAVEDKITGYICEKNNIADLYEKMKKFTELSYDQRLNMGLLGRKRMEEIFDKKLVVSETINSLGEI